MKKVKFNKKVIKLSSISAGVLLILSMFLFSNLGHCGLLGSDKKSDAVEAPKLQVVSYADAVAVASPAVVSINTTKEIPFELNPLFQDPFLRQFLFENPNTEIFLGPNKVNRKQNGLGSGVIVNNQGYILTNNHVIQGSDSIIVTLKDGKTADAKLIGVDEDTDLAVLQIKTDQIPAIPIGSSKKLRVGDVVLAIGNPFGFDRTVTQGILSATERSGVEINILSNLLQTDAAINPGNSGGALIDAYGNLVGINTAIVSKTGGYQGIGFAIPIENALEIMNKLISTGHITRGYLGVTLQNIDKELCEQIGYKNNEGVFIRAIVPNSPAHKAGLLPGDVITKVNESIVKDNKSAMQMISNLLPGKNYTLEICRRGENMIFTIALGERKGSKSLIPSHSSQDKNENDKNMKR